MVSIELDMIQTAGIGALALIVGMVLTRKVAFLQKFCVPSPVSGGIIFSLITLILYGWCNVEVSFDGTLKDVFMLAFFTSVGFQSDLKVIKQGGKLLVIMLALLVAIIALQNIMPMGITRLMGVDPLIGMAAGSISMTGGHGTAGGFASVLEGMGLHGAGTIGMAAATFGLIAGSMIGGPLAERIIRKKLTHEQMQPQKTCQHKRTGVPAVCEGILLHYPRHGWWHHLELVVRQDRHHVPHLFRSLNPGCHHSQPHRIRQLQGRRW